MKLYLHDIENRFSYRELRVEGIVSYGVDNKYPQLVREVVRQSGIARSCVDTYAKHISGKGFGDEQLYRLDLGGMRADRLLRALAYDYARYRGFAVHLNYNALGQITAIAHVPFEFVRRGVVNTETPLQYAVYDNWDEQRRFRRDKIAYLDPFDPDPERVSQQAAAAGGVEQWNGQLYYYSADGDDYPLAAIDPELESAITDHEIALFHYSNITTGFMPSTIVERRPMEGEEEREAYEATMRQFQGAKNAGKLMTVENEFFDDAPLRFHKFEVANLDKLYERTEQANHQRIRKLFGLPPILVGDFVPGRLGATQEYREALEIYDLKTTEERLLLEETFAQLLQYWHQPLQLQNFSIIPLSDTKTD